MGIERSDQPVAGVANGPEVFGNLASNWRIVLGTIAGISLLVGGMLLVAGCTPAETRPAPPPG